MDKRDQALQLQIAGNGATIVLHPGQVTLLYGRSGAGKTTLLEKLAGLRAADGLTVTYGAEPMWLPRVIGKPQLNSAALRSYAYACQAPEQGLFFGSVQEELDYSLRPYHRTDSERTAFKQQALRAIGWSEEWLPRDPYEMSGGERRRAALASVFVTPVGWYLLDEPTAGLDGGGHELLAAHIQQLKQAGAGIVIASHDSDWALPLADKVLLIYGEGEIGETTREQIMERPQILTEAGMDIPLWLELAHHLHQNGAMSAQLWEPETAADATLVREQLTPLEPNASNESPRQGQSTVPGMANLQNSVGRTDQVAHRVSAIQSNKPMSPLARFDPRAVWLCYILFTIGVFSQTTWLGLLFGAVAVTGVLLIGRISLRSWRGVIAMYVVFSVLASAFFAAGAGAGESWFDVPGFIATLFAFARTVLVMVPGLAVATVITPLSLRASLEQLLSFRGRTNTLVTRFILVVTLMMRFVPVLLREWERYARIAVARGKETGLKPWRMMRRMTEAAIPFLLSLFRMADDVAVALESRGIGSRTSPTRALQLRFGWRDYAIMLGMALMIWFWRRWG